MHDEVIIQYIGCIGVDTSMRSLAPEVRAIVTQECINRLCKANNIDRNAEERAENDDITHSLQEPDLRHSGKRVSLVIDTFLRAIDRETNEIIVKHEMADVPFASREDSELADYVAYVAKTDLHKRSCFVLQCTKGSGKDVLESIAQGFKRRTQLIHRSNHKKSPLPSHNCFNGTISSRVFHDADSNDISLEASNEVRENAQQNEALVSETRASLENEPWFHGSYLSREESETRLKQDGDFLVRESMLDPGHFVLSIMNDGTKLHLLFDTMGQVRTKELVFDNISELVSYHHKQGKPIVAENRVIYLKNGVRPGPRLVKQSL